MDSLYGFCGHLTLEPSNYSVAFTSVSVRDIHLPLLHDTIGLVNWLSIINISHCNGLLFVSSMDNLLHLLFLFRMNFARCTEPCTKMKILLALL